MNVIQKYKLLYIQYFCFILMWGVRAVYNVDFQPIKYWNGFEQIFTA